MPKVSYLSVLVGVTVIGSAAIVYEWYRTKENERKRRTALPAPNESSELSRIQMKLSNDKVALVNGRAGHTLDSIQEQSNTTISIREQDDTHHIFEIVGTYRNVLEAERLIRECVKSDAAVTETMTIPAGVFAAGGGKATQDISRKSNAQVYIDSNAAQDPTRGLELRIIGTKPNVQFARQLINEKVQEAQKQLVSDEVVKQREPRGTPPSHGTNEDDGYRSMTNTSDQIDGSRSVSMRPNALQGQLEVFVSASASISKFWVQLCGPQTAKLDRLVDEMTEYYEVEANRDAHRLSDQYLGQIVATQFKYDAKWYRAEVVGICPSEYDPRNVVLDVFFVDYGDSQYVDPKEVYGIRTDFLTLRFQAIECFLADVKPARASRDGEWNAESKSRFEELTHVARWKKLVAHVVTTKEKNANNAKAATSVTGIALFDRSNNQQIDVAETLVNEGLAIFTSARVTKSPGRFESTTSDSSEPDRRITTSTPSNKSTNKRTTKTFKNGSIKNGSAKSTASPAPSKPAKPSSATKKAANTSNSNMSNGSISPDTTTSIHDDRFSGFQNKSWHEMVEEEED